MNVLQTTSLTLSAEITELHYSGRDTAKHVKSSPLGIIGCFVPLRSEVTDESSAKPAKSRHIRRCAINNAELINFEKGSLQVEPPYNEDLGPRSLQCYFIWMRVWMCQWDVLKDLCEMFEGTVHYSGEILQ